MYSNAVRIPSWARNSSLHFISSVLTQAFWYPQQSKSRTSRSNIQSLRNRPRKNPPPKYELGTPNIWSRTQNALPLTPYPVLGSSRPDEPRCQITSFQKYWSRPCKAKFCTIACLWAWFGASNTRMHHARVRIISKHQMGRTLYIIRLPLFLRMPL